MANISDFQLNLYMSGFWHPVPDCYQVLEEQQCTLNKLAEQAAFSLGADLLSWKMSFRQKQLQATTSLESSILPMKRVAWAVTSAKGRTATAADPAG